MGSAIIAGILALLNSIIDIFRRKSEEKKVAIEKANTEEEVRKAEIVQEVQIRDEAEELVKKAQENDPKALEEIRRRVAGN